jgi:Dullard-like phosphatase family protein
LASK